MCSFMRFSCLPKDVKQNMAPVADILAVKGGDEYNFIIKSGEFIARIRNKEIRKAMESVDDVELSEVLINLVDKKTRELPVNSYCQVIGFSRLTPEMESSHKSLSQPYHNINDDTIIVVHGTIPNAEEIAESNNISIEVDTELFNYLPFDYVCNKVEQVGGKISAMMIDENGNIRTYQNGLGLYQFWFQGAPSPHTLAADVLIDTNIDIRNMITHHKMTLTETYEVPESQKPPRIISLYSGGLDIACATQRVIYDLEENEIPFESIDLWYFDWGTVANVSEMEAGIAMRDHIREEQSIKAEFGVIEVQPMFRNILTACDMTTTRLIDKDADGAGSHEAEAAISYVPYRNTFLLTLAAARAEQLYPGERCIFVIGANLSEGMVYLDNSETFITAMNHLIKVGGQKSMNFEVHAPYVNRTKTEMVKDAYEKNFKLDTSFSCYFPVNGEPCGKCGSCLLRENALKRGK